MLHINKSISLPITLALVGSMIINYFNSKVLFRIEVEKFVAVVKLIENEAEEKNPIQVKLSLHAKATIIAKWQINFKRPAIQLQVHLVLCMSMGGGNHLPSNAALAPWPPLSQERV